jgi:hypothetical protein
LSESTVDVARYPAMEHSTLILISFIVYSLFIIGVGLYSTRRRKKTVADYVLANRELGPWVSASRHQQAPSPDG